MADGPKLEVVDAASIPPISMTVTFDQAHGQLRVEGIPGSQVLALGMLELAKDVVRGQVQSRVQQSNILVPGPRRIV
jgi:hypothetical protein